MTLNEALCRIFDAEMLQQRVVIRTHDSKKYHEISILQRTRHNPYYPATIIRWPKGKDEDFGLFNTITSGRAADLIRQHWSERLKG